MLVNMAQLLIKILYNLNFTNQLNTITGKLYSHNKHLHYDENQETHIGRRRCIAGFQENDYQL